MRQLANRFCVPVLCWVRERFVLSAARMMCVCAKRGLRCGCVVEPERGSNPRSPTTPRPNVGPRWFEGDPFSSGPWFSWSCPVRLSRVELRVARTVCSRVGGLFARPNESKPSYRKSSTWPSVPPRKGEGFALRAARGGAPRPFVQQGPTPSSNHNTHHHHQGQTTESNQNSNASSKGRQTIRS